MFRHRMWVASVVGFIQLLTQLSHAAEHYDGVFIIQLRRGDHAAPPIEKQFRVLPPKEFPNGDTFENRYGFLKEDFIRAFDLAEEAHGGAVGQVTRENPARLIVYRDDLPFIGILWSKQQPGFIDIYLSSGMIDFVQGVIGGLVLDAHRSRGEATPAGIGFDDWMQGLRDGKKFVQGNEYFWPGPRPPIERNFFTQNLRVGCIVTYTFLFSHELGHYVLDLPSQKGEEALPIEMKIDRAGWEALVHNNMALPPTIVCLEMALLYAQRIYAPEMKRAIQRLDAEKIFREMLRGSDWQKRATMIVDDWELRCKTKPAGVLAKPGWQAAVAYCRELIATPPPPEGGGLVPKGEEFARALQALVRAAETRFESVKKRNLPDSNDGSRFEPTLSLPGAMKLEILFPFEGTISPSLSVFFSTTDPQRGKQQYVELCNQAKAALGGWNATESKSSERGLERLTLRLKKDDWSTSVAVKYANSTRNGAELRIQVSAPPLK